MTGHFEKGAWIEDPEPPREKFPPLMMKVGIDVDDTKIQELKATLEEMQELFAVPESMSTFWQRLRWLITGKVRP
jgi:hypothetical protein